jgi:hypothetical protein
VKFTQANYKQVGHKKESSEMTKRIKKNEQPRSRAIEVSKRNILLIFRRRASGY